MPEKFTVINGGRNIEKKTLPAVREKILRAIAPFKGFAEMADESQDEDLYSAMSDNQLAYEAELLTNKLKDPGNALGDLLNRAVVLLKCIQFRISS